MRHRVRGDPSGRRPVRARPTFGPGTHINLVGSYRLDLREVGADLVAASTVAVDDVAAARAEAGDLHLAVEEGVWSWDRIAGDLTDLASGRLRRTSADEITLFKSVGSRSAGPGDRPTRCRGSRNPGDAVTKSVVIVGGGLVGLSSALFLTEAGADVTIIDNAALGSGAARGNAGFMCTAIVEPLPAPGAIGNALKSLRDPMRALRILPKATAENGALAADVRPQLHCVALPIRTRRAGRVQPQQRGDPRTA